MFIAAMTMMIMTTACSSDSLDDETTSYSSSSEGDTTDGAVTTTTLSTMKTFSIAVDKTTAEPASTATATYPAEGNCVQRFTEWFTVRVVPRRRCSTL